MQLYIYISENNMLHVRQHLFHEMSFYLFFFLPNTDIIMTLLQYFLCCIIISFQVSVMKITFGTALKTHKRHVD